MAFGTRRLLLPFALLLTGFFCSSDASDLLGTLGCKTSLSRQVFKGQNFTFLNNGSTNLFSLLRLSPSQSLICEWLNGTVKENYLKCAYGNSSVSIINLQPNDSGIYQLNNGPCIILTVTGDLSSTSPPSTDQAEPTPTPPHSPRSHISLAITFVVILFVAVLFVRYLYRSRKGGENTNDNIQSYCKVAQNGQETSAPTHVTTGDCIDSVKVF